MDVHVRRANSDDTEFLAAAMLSASRGHLAYGLWDLIIGADEAGCLDYLKRLASAEPPSLYHYQSYVIAEVAGYRAAALCGFETGSKSPVVWSIVGEAMSNVQRDLGWTEAQAVASSQRVAPIWAACMPPDIGADFVIENVATRPEYRRRGLVSTLIEEMLRDASGRGCRLAQISTYIGNDAAVSAYEKSGFRILDEKRCTEVQKILGVPGFIRLTREVKID
jgi:ribosomal protein S18 acetylase RimI-like enzyme